MQQQQALHIISNAVAAGDPEWSWAASFVDPIKEPVKEAQELVAQHKYLAMDLSMAPKDLEYSKSSNGTHGTSSSSCYG